MKIKREFKGFAKEKKRNKIGSISNNNSNFNHISNSNNQCGIWRGWTNCKDATGKRINRAGYIRGARKFKQFDGAVCKYNGR